jgi:hypothetical protein
MTDTPASPTPPTPVAPSPKKRSLGRLLLRLCGILVVLVIVLLLGVYFARNYIVRVGVQQGGQYATAQTTTLLGADLNVFGGSLNLSQLLIANPTSAGFKEPTFLTMKSCDVLVDPGSLATKTIVVDKIMIDGLELTLEQQGAKNNLAVLLDIMKQKSAAASPRGTASAPAPKSTAPESPGTALKINEILLTNTKVHLRGLVPTELKLGNIRIKEPTNPDGRPMKIADVMVTVLLNISQGIVGSPELPKEFKDGLGSVSQFVDSLKLGDVGKQAGQAVQGVTSQAGNAIDDLGKGLGGLIPGLGGSTSKPATKP